MSDSAVKLAQSILVSSDPSLAVDGVLGPKTVAAYEKAPRPLREQVDEVLRRHEDTSFLALRRSNRTVAKTSGGAVLTYVRPRTAAQQVKIAAPTRVMRRFVSFADARALARKYDSVYGLEFGTLEFILDIEAQKVRGGYDPAGIGGAGKRYRGLYQIFDDQRYAWADGTRWALTKGVQVAAMYPDGWHDAEHNTACAGGYALMNRQILMSAGIPVTRETLYAAHQQGAAGFVRTVKSKRFAYAGKQSGPSVDVLKSAFAVATA